jgi:acyl-CoA synthetase (AMP-forming)/AMP-acid ligase II
MKELTFHRWFLPWVERWPNRTGYADVGGGSSTYGEHAERCFRLASGIRKELGVEPGDKAAILATNSRADMELYHTSYIRTSSPSASPPCS